MEGACLGQVGFGVDMDENRIIDLAVFMGQSNMAGRGTAADAPVLMAGMGYEFRAVTAPDRLYALQEPFGKDENNPDGVYEPGMKTGSMVSAFVKACVEITHVPIVGVNHGSFEDNIDSVFCT